MQNDSFPVVVYVATGALGLAAIRSSVLKNLINLSFFEVNFIL